MSDRSPIEEAELVTAAAAQFQARNPDSAIASVEILDLAEMEAHGMKCLDCGAPIASCFWIQKCDPCLDEMLERLKNRERP